MPVCRAPTSRVQSEEVSKCKAFYGSSFQDETKIFIHFITKENIMDNLQDVQEIVELAVEELEERTAPGMVVVF